MKRRFGGRDSKGERSGCRAVALRWGMWSSSKLAVDEARRDDDGDKRHGASERSVEVEEEEELPTGVGMGNSQDPSWVVGLDWIGLD